MSLYWRQWSPSGADNTRFHVEITVINFIYFYYLIVNIINNFLTQGVSVVYVLGLWFGAVVGELCLTVPRFSSPL